MNYYNELDPFAAEWLRKLIVNGQIPFGVVDERDVTTVRPADLLGFRQCHFFAGIGGWSLALKLAGWPEDRPVWTGSPPCQPFSAIGTRSGKEDSRHLWPEFFDLIRQCRPPVIFGEQVVPAIGHGWFDDLRTDMEAENYAAGMVVLPACGVGAFHKRDRLFFVGKSRYKGLEGYERAEHDCNQPGWVATDPRGSTATTGFQLVACLDGRLRATPLEPEIQPLAHGLPGRMGMLRGAGNAVVPQVAAEVIKAYMERNNASPV